MLSSSKTPYTITRGKTQSQASYNYFPPVPSLSQQDISPAVHSEGDRPPIRIISFLSCVIGTYFLDLKVLQMCTDLCLTYVSLGGGCRC